jgi:RNA polymerase sigma-70 factor (ECF subfamily)
MEAMPHLRAFAISLTGDAVAADDLVQDALLRALSNIDRFKPGTNIKAWLFTILRNAFYSDYRKRHREVEDPDGILAGRLAIAPEQGARLAYEDMLVALAHLPARQREAIVLVAAEGFTYEEAARVCNTSIGTIKSRINRARNALAVLLDVDRDQGLGCGPIVQSMLIAA